MRCTAKEERIDSHQEIYGKTSCNSRSVGPVPLYEATRKHELFKDMKASGGEKRPANPIDHRATGMNRKVSLSSFVRGCTESRQGC